MEATNPQTESQEASKTIRAYQGMVLALLIFLGGYVWLSYHTMGEAVVYEKNQPWIDGVLNQSLKLEPINALCSQVDYGNHFGLNWTVVPTTMSEIK